MTVKHPSSAAPMGLFPCFFSLFLFLHNDSYGATLLPAPKVQIMPAHKKSPLSGAFSQKSMLYEILRKGDNASNQLFKLFSHAFCVPAFSLRSTYLPKIFQVCPAMFLTVKDEPYGFFLNFFIEQTKWGIVIRNSWEIIKDRTWRAFETICRVSFEKGGKDPTLADRKRQTDTSERNPLKSEQYGRTAGSQM